MSAKMTSHVILSLSHRGMSFPFRQRSFANREQSAPKLPKRFANVSRSQNVPVASPLGRFQWFILTAFEHSRHLPSDAFRFDFEMTGDLSCLFDEGRALSTVIVFMHDPLFPLAWAKRRPEELHLPPDSLRIAARPAAVALGGHDAEESRP
jgi:hypothetical protein